MKALVIVILLVILLVIIGIKSVVASKEGEELSGVSKFIAENKVLVTAYVFAILFMAMLVAGFLLEAPAWFMEVMATGLVISIIVEHLFKPYH